MKISSPRPLSSPALRQYCLKTQKIRTPLLLMSSLKTFAWTNLAISLSIHLRFVGYFSLNSARASS